MIVGDDYTSLTPARRAELAARGWWAGWCFMWMRIGMEVVSPARDLYELCDAVRAYVPPVLGDGVGAVPDLTGYRIVFA